MTSFRVYVMSRDSYWLEAVQRAAAPDWMVEIIWCVSNPFECLKQVARVDATALFLVDAAWESAVTDVVKALREMGWQYVVVVAAAPSWKEARAVLKDAAGHDYWRKTYSVHAIRDDLCRLIRELHRIDGSMAAGDTPGKMKPSREGTE